MEVFLTFLGLAIVVGTVGGLGLFLVERWLERRDAKRTSDQELLDIDEEMSNEQPTQPETPAADSAFKEIVLYNKDSN